ncbi:MULTISPECIES: tetratricopeptide repeat protein [Oceanibaculum]|uniref:Uncharacterized protein n=2 Tax=Oceanibaculum indicum TaxID=526216 RepID=K2JGT3_9PROT|nr:MULTISPECIES: tetratricopeptide repeat protein [Oceanibaculum]EKE69859.1 hypothetical protein P24_16190 [Oceanibaculum indicum P24]MCH2394452.1 tetratricopeptide repeat protein [Oceanibaculum sp.]RKQ72636.1 tetratricopeptide repeat protein [Oceanibaculum indicum]
MTDLSAIRILPTDPEHYIGLGREQEARGDIDDAIDSYRTAIFHAPRSVPALTALGDLLVRLGQNDAAVRCYRLALLVDPTCRTAARNVAQLKTSGEVSLYRLGLALHPMPEMVSLGTARVMDDAALAD